MDNYDDEHFASHTFSSKVDNADRVFATLRHQPSDDDIYHSVKSDDDHASLLFLLLSL
jgi:hypothetical protein